MYSNLGKTQLIPLVFRISSQPNFLKPSQNFKFQSFSNGVSLKPSDTLNGVILNCSSIGVSSKASENLNMIKPRHFSSRVFGKVQQKGHVLLRAKNRNLSSGFSLPNHNVIKKRDFSNGYSRKDMETDGGSSGRNTLPWVEGYKKKEAKPSSKVSTAKDIRSSWEESANRFIVQKGANDPVENTGDRNRGSASVERDEGGFGREEVVDDPRWDRIKSRYKRISDRVGPEKPEVRRWNKQEDWGKKTWKEASESTLPKMSGEGVYGVGPVLAALSAGRREFYTLYVQQGLDLSSNNRKKKDKKGFERILKIAEKLGLTKKEISKHDLNMIVDNRPHQGLVLDASPLDLVSIKELDALLVDGERGPLWVALDEVTDPQNLGAIIRSCYFFGAAGVILCAKNSAPLSGVVSKASAGSLELMELRSCKNMMQFLTLSAENGWRVFGGSVSSRAIPLNEVPVGAPTILVLGSEGKGLRPLVERSCTDLIRIPGNIPVDISAVGGEDENADEVDYCSSKEFRSFMAVESLNVSVAAGVLLHHFVGNNYHVDDKQASVPLEALSAP